MPRKIRGPPTEQQRYKEYERRIRVANGATKQAADARIRTTWLARGTNGRTTIRQLAIRALNATDKVTRRDAASTALFVPLTAWINGLINQPQIGEELNSGNYRTRIEQSQNATTKLRRALIEARDAWLALHAEYSHQQPPSDMISINNAFAEHTKAVNDLVNTNTRLGWLQTQLSSPPVAPNAAGIRKVRKGWLPPEVVRNWRLAMDRASTMPPATIAPDAGLLLGGWDLHRQIGAGGQGTSDLWLGFNAHNRMTRRIVRKSVDESRSWHDARKFTGADVRHVNNRMPWELETHREMARAHNNLPPNNHIVALGAPITPALVHVATKMYRIYTEWCPRGDLDSVIHHYNQVHHGPIPEPFIWAVAEALTCAGTAMLTGTESGAPLPGWQPIVHRDLKPQNIFLGNSSLAPNAWLYPTIRLGDWGLAIQPNAYGVSNPGFWQDVGTEGFLAPEQIHYVNRNTGADMNTWPLSEKTNVFGMGLVLYCLVTMRRSHQQAYWLGNGATDTTYQLENVNGVPHPHQPNAGFYSQQLRSFIDQCTRFDPGTRPDFQALRADLLVTFNPLGAGESATWTKGMRSGTAAPGVRLAEGLWGQNADIYQLNMLRGTIPP